jgi:iron complex outermembrane receptor protein
LSTLLVASLFSSPCFAGEEMVALFKLSLEELLNTKVTAQKRVERLIDVPVAISVLRKELVSASYATNLEELQAYVPAMSYRKGNTTRNSAFTVRGVGTISFSIAAEPSVSTLVDGVVLGRSGQAFADLYDVERIEVLRGPQGTLFGKNASAGVVHIITTSPTDSFESQINTMLTEDREFRTFAKVAGPLSENVRASLSLITADYDGYIRNVYDGSTVNGYDRQGMRAKLDYDVDENSTLKFILEYYRANDNCCADVEALPSNRSPNSVSVPDSNGVIDGGADIDLLQRRVDHDFETRTIDKTDALSIQLEKRLGDFDLTSISAYREWENTEYREGDFTAIGGDSSLPVFTVPFQLHDIGPQKWRQTSQEIRLASPQDDDTSYQVGVFLWHMSSSRNFTRYASCQNDLGQNDSILIANPGVSCDANDIVDATSHMSTKFTNLALFADGKHNLSDSMRLLYGLRYTDDEVDFSHKRVNNDPYGRRGVGVRPAAEDTDFSGTTRNSNLSAKIGLQYDLNRTSRLYSTLQQGYKGPGFNVFYNMSNGDTASIGPEESLAFEIGYKTQMDDLLLSAAYFHSTFNGFQANNFDTSGGTTITRLTNAGDVITTGIESDLVWQPSENFRLIAGVAITKAEIGKFNCPAGELCTNRSGLDVPFSPDLKYSLATSYEIPIGENSVTLKGAYIFTDVQHSELPGNTGTFSAESLLPSYAVFNTSVDYSMSNNKFQFTLFVKNLFGESYTSTYSGDGFRYQIPRNADRHAGISFKAKF